MSIVAVTSAKGSPGVTTAALALAWVWPQVAPGRRALVVDADMAGGDIAAGFLRGEVSASDGLLAVAADRGDDPASGLWQHLVAVDTEGTRLVLTGITDPAQARGLVPAWPGLADLFADLDDADPPVDVIIDMGRLGGSLDPGEVRARADLVLLVTRSSLVSVAHARSAAPQLRCDHPTTTAGPAGLGLLVVRERHPYSAREVSAAVGLPLLGCLAWDPGVAAVFTDGAPVTRRLPRSALVRSTLPVAEAVLCQLIDSSRGVARSAGDESAAAVNGQVRHA